MSDTKCEFCGDVGWIVVRQTYSSPAGEQEQCPLCGCREEIKRLNEVGLELRDALEPFAKGYERANKSAVWASNYVNIDAYGKAAKTFKDTE